MFTRGHSKNLLAGIDFGPLCAEAIGGWEEEAEKMVKENETLQAQRLGLSTGQTVRHLFQRLADCLWRGNASL